jgi:Domain of unknown function (DUF4157)
MNLPQGIAGAVSDARAKVRFGYPFWLRPFLMGDVVAITLGRRVYLSAKILPASTERILRHELAHVRQVNRLGLLRFYWRYLAEFAGHFARERSVDRAYHRLSFEREAVAAERDAGPIIG